MKTREILENIKGNGGFCNLNKWNEKEIKTWVKANFGCSDYVAKRVAEELNK